MNIKGIILGLISSLAISGAVAQVEQDDMYFNAKDRAKLNEARKSDAVAMASNSVRNREDEEFNPTDSYSARNVNPEYTSRANTQSSQADEEDYYVSNYRYDNQSNFNNWNNNFNSWYGSSWYRPNFYSPNMYGWNSPYAYGFNDPYSSPWYDPYYSNNRWSSSFSFYYGSYWNRPYCLSGFNSYYGSGSYWNYRYPQTVVIVNNGESGGRGISYGKRPTRGSAIVGNNQGNRSRDNSVIGSGGRTDNSGGRVTTNRNQSEYYNRNWNNTNTSSPAMDSRQSTQSNRPSYNSNNNSSNSSFGSSNSGRSNSSFGSGSSNSGSSAPTRTSSSGSSSSNGGRTRGGN